MKDFANKTSAKRRNITKKKTLFRARDKSDPVVSKKSIFTLISLALCLALISIVYFDTDVIEIEPKNSSNNITIDFPSSLVKDAVLIETKILKDFESCEYFVQIGAYGNKKYAYEAKNILNEIELISINEVYSTSNPTKLLHSVISGPFENRSAANNAKEQITKNGFDPRLRVLCKKN